jgi:hypothetical protein
MKITTDKYQRENLLGLVLTIITATTLFFLAFNYERNRLNYSPSNNHQTPLDFKAIEL